MDISELQHKLVAFRDEREWKQFHNPKDLSLSLVLEAAEVLEHFQWKNGEEVAKHLSTNRHAVGEEMADVLWYLLLLADELDIDLDQALQDKIAKNMARYSVEKAKGNHKKYTELGE